MNNKRATKRALLTSVMALVMCVVMLVGTTFAWFTDTASTGVNKIQAGNLDITVEYAKEKMNADGTLAGELTDWAPIDNATNVFDPNALWEPGRTEYVVFRITNNGNLALKYKLSLETLAQKSGTNKAGKQFYLADYLCASAKVDVGPGEIGSGVSTLGAFMTKLNDLGVAGVQNVLDPEYHPLTDATVNGTLLPGKTNCVPMAIWMPTSVGNEANAIDSAHAATIDFGINVVATQYTYEKDSFDDQYDKDAEYPTTADNAADLQAALAAGKDVMLTKSVALTAPLSISKDVTITGNGYAVISEYPVDVAPTAEVTFDGVNFAVPKNNNNNASSVYASRLEGKVVFDGCTFTNPQWECIQITPKDGAEIVVTNCTFIVDGTGTYAHGAKVERMLHIQNTEATGDYTVTITNNKFIGIDKVRNSVIDVDDIKAFGNVICGGNSFATADGTLVATLDDSLIYVNLTGRYDAASVATNTFAQFTQTSAAALHH